MGRESWWLRRPSASRAWVSVLVMAALAAFVSLEASRVSPFAARSLLPLNEVSTRDLYLTTLPEDPQRVLLTTKRRNSTLPRGRTRQAGNPYWIRRYDDPTRPDVPGRILLSSRSRGARLLLPLASLDLERALVTAEPEETRAAGDAKEEQRVRSGLVQVFQDRLFAGIYLELRFPPRELDENGEPIDFDLVCVRDNRVRTVDFLLHPHGRHYRAGIAAGTMPAGDLRVQPLEDELVFQLFEDPDRPAAPLFVPVSLFDELGLSWGDQVPTLIDDRWRIDTLPEYEPRSPEPEQRIEAARLAALHLAARLESDQERQRIADQARALASNQEWLR